MLRPKTAKITVFTIVAAICAMLFQTAAPIWGTTTTTTAAPAALPKHALTGEIKK